MSRKRLSLFVLPVATALAAAGVAAAGALRGPSVEAASATFAATTVSHQYQVTCSVNGGDTFQATRAVYTGEATSSDPRLAGGILRWSRLVAPARPLQILSVDSNFLLTVRRP